MKGQKVKVVRRKYDEEFKEQALKLIDNGQSVRSVARDLGVGENLLHKWKHSKHGTRPLLEQENAQLRAKVKQLETEREILKKALSIFSRLT
jgi:transposase